jgi:hypothetical protein
MKIIIAVLFIASPCLAMGNLPPRPDSDPATWGDVKAVQSQVTKDETHEQTDITNVNNRLDDIDKLKIQMGTTVRLYDAKYGSLNFFGLYDVQGTGGNAIGLNVGFKLGKSYEQRLIEKQQNQIDLLLQKLTPSIQ